MKAKLTKRTVDALAPRPDRYDVFDCDLTGFHVRVMPSGAKVYRLKYVAGGAQRQARIGEHGPLTPEQARKEATRLRGMVDSGADPNAERERRAREAAEARRRALTVAELVERWLMEGRDAAPGKRESSWATDARKLRRHIVPLLGDIQVTALTKGDIERAQRLIGEGATAVDERTEKKRGRAIVRGGRGVARSSVMCLSACLSWAIDQEIIAANPCARVKKERVRRRERFLSETEAAALLDALAAMEAERTLRPAFGDMIRVLLLTGARKSEIQNLRWREIDFGRGHIVLPRERSKTGEKVIPLSAPAAAILAARARASEVVFPSSVDPNKPADGVQKAWERVRMRAGLTDVRLHDLRHSFASFAAASGASLVLIGKALGHTQPATTARYAHLGNDPVRALADGVAARILGGDRGKGSESAEVVPLPRKARRPPK